MPTLSPSFRYLLLILTLFATTLQASCDITATRKVQGSSTETIENICEQNLTTFTNSCEAGERATQGTLNDCKALPHIDNSLNILYTECIAGKAPNQGYLDACPLDRATISLGLNNHQAEENLTVGSIVGYISMAHMGNNSAISSFSLSNSEYFELNSSGAIKLVKELDYETTVEYNLTLTVTNGAGISKRESLDIAVENINENTPLLVKPTSITEFTYSGDANWVEDNDTYSTPTGSWKNDDIGDDESACIETSINVDSTPYQLIYQYKVDTNEKGDYLYFYIDDVKQSEEFNTNWTSSQLYELALGNYAFKWCYKKDSSKSNGSDTAWIDDIIVGEMHFTLSEDIDLGQIGSIGIVLEDADPIDSIEIIEGNERKQFEVALDGTLSLISKLDYETQREYTLHFKAHNLLGDSNIVTRTITVTDVDDLYITHAFYNDNATTDDTTDDKLLLQYSKTLDEPFVEDHVKENFVVNSSETIDNDNSTGEYNSTKIYYQHIISLTDPTTLKDQNISIAPNTLTADKEYTLDTTKTLILAVTGSKILKKTGQVEGYDELGEKAYHQSIKDDGYYQSGVTPQYSRDDGNNTVTDHIIGLMWADDSDASSVRKQWLTTDNYNTCKADNNDSACFDTDGDTAVEYCKGLNLGEFDDWRLPTIEELMYIVDRAKIEPSMNNIFENVASNDYWSFSTFVDHKQYGWYTNFSHGIDGWDNKSSKYHVRCVRDVQ